MAEIDISISVKETERDFVKFIEKEISNQLQALLRKIKPSLRKQVEEVVDRKLKAQPEWESLIGGQLRVMLGLAQIVDPQKVLENILEVIKQNIEINILPPTGTIFGAVQINILRSDFQDVLAVDGATYISVSHPMRFRGSARIYLPSLSTEVPWLEWMLFRGTERVTIADIHMKKEFYSGSRTGKAVMFYHTNNSQGFSLPGDFSGRVENNFLTRSLSGCEQEFTNILIKSLENG